MPARRFFETRRRERWAGDVGAGTSESESASGGGGEGGSVLGWTGAERGGSGRDGAGWGGRAGGRACERVSACEEGRGGSPLPRRAAPAVVSVYAEEH